LNPEQEPRRGFDPADLHSYLQSTVIALPLLNDLKEHPRTPHRVLITLHSDFGTPEAAATKVRAIVDGVLAKRKSRSEEEVGRVVSQYLMARLTARSIRELVRQDRSPGPPAIYQIWPDFPIVPLINKSVSTVKADAARVTFAALGADIVWAVVDSGVDKNHQHFRTYGNLDLPAGLEHQDFTDTGPADEDVYGHGSHVAGIIAGAWPESGKADYLRDPLAVRAVRNENGDTDYVELSARDFAGMAPKCKIVSYKVLDSSGDGNSTAIIGALQHIQETNRFGNKLKIHGVNLSVGYPIDPTWFACGQSPICVEVSRLVNSGVVVVVAAGNTGYGYNVDFVKGSVAAGQGQTINDPGNADAAITVGSTHRDMPHTYGVSYFSSKGPTGDGRAKPDVIAPGEKILSCAAGDAGKKIAGKKGKDSVDYVEDSGTSMAAAHVSGVIAAFLSVRREFIGRPTEVKDIFTSTATDLGRVADFQGRGLIDLMRAIQSV
jgi:serine protease AprX